MLQTQVDPAYALAAEVDLRPLLAAHGMNAPSIGTHTGAARQPLARPHQRVPHE